MPRAARFARHGLAALLALACAGLGLFDALGREGLNVLGFEPQPLRAWWLAQGALALVLLAPERRSGGLGRLAALLALAGCVLLWVHHDWLGERAREQAGTLEARLQPADGSPAVGLSLVPERLRGARRAAAALGRSRGYELTAHGTLVAPETGSYLLSLSCAARCAILLDGHEVARAPGKDSVELALRAGAYSLVARLAAEAEDGYLRLGWRRPARFGLASIYRAIGQPLSAQAFREREQAAARRALLLGGLFAGAALSFAALAASLAGWRRRLVSALRGDPVLRRAAALGLCASAIVLGAGRFAERWSPDGLHLHAWTGEYLMQTVSIADLRVEPLRSLLYLHIQPPLIDTLRMLSAARHAELDGGALLAASDRDLYSAWALLAGALAGLVYCWLHALAGPRAALLGAALLVVHPAFLFYATFLDTTFASGTLVCWASYELWRLARGEQASLRLAGALSLAFLTRSIVQWPFLLVLAGALFLLRIERARALRAFVPFALVVLLYTGKQYALFGLTVTSSFGPDSFCKGLSAFCHGTTPVPLPELPPPAAASVLRRIEKLDGEYNWNQLAFLKRSFSQMAEYRALVRQTPVRKLAGLVAHTVGIWLRPSSRHSPHVLVDRLPWRAPFDFLMSGPALVGLLLAASTVAVRRAGLSLETARRGLGLALPCLYFFAVSVVFESGENMRYKFFVEPTLWVFLVAQCAALLAQAAPPLAPQGAQGGTP